MCNRAVAAPVGAQQANVTEYGCSNRKRDNGITYIVCQKLGAGAFAPAPFAVSDHQLLVVRPGVHIGDDLSESRKLFLRHHARQPVEQLLNMGA